MQKTMSLNDMYNQYSAGLLERKKFEGLVFENILGEYRRYNCYGWPRYEYNEYVSWLYPRLRRAIDGYRETGSAFEAYISTMIRLTVKEYHSRKKDRSAAEYAAWTVRLTDMYTCDAEPEYSEPEYPAPENGVAHNGKNIRNPRQLLILILKCYHFISEGLLERLALRLKMEKETLKEMIERVRALRLERDEKLCLMRERMYCQFFRCLAYERQLKLMPEGSGAAYRMELKLGRAKRRLESMRKRLAGVRSDATNRQIAEIIGISKGAVDASLYFLKSRWKNSEKTAILN